MAAARVTRCVLARPGERWTSELPDAGDDVVRTELQADESLAAGLARLLPVLESDYLTIETGAVLRLPGGTERQLQLADAEPGIVLVGGSGVLLDRTGQGVGSVESTFDSSERLLRAVIREGESFAPGLLLIARAAITTLGGLPPEADDRALTDLLLRLAETGRVRALGGAPVAQLDRDGDIALGDDQAIAAAAARVSLRTLVPELDWPVLDPQSAELQALKRLATDVQRSGERPLLLDAIRSSPGFAREPFRPARDKGRLLITAYGYNDSGGGTLIPRLLSKEFVRRGWDVAVFHAVVARDVTAGPYSVTESEQDGVRLFGIQNRAHGIWDFTRPDREISDPQITEAFERVVQQFKPEVVHFHNLHNLGAELIDVAAAHGLRSFFTTHNYWALCPRAYFIHSDGHMCTGPGVDGQLCAACNGVDEAAKYAARLDGIRERIESSCDAVLAISDAVRRTFTAQGYDPDAVDVVAQSSPSVEEIWQQVGRDRRPGPIGDDALVVGFIGSALAHKGPQLLVEAAQRTSAAVRVRIHGEIDPEMRSRLEQADRRGVLECRGTYSLAELPSLLADIDAAALPSTIWDCQNIAVLECMAARVPVLVPRMGGMPELIRDEVDGLLFTGGDVEGLAHQLDRLASEPGLLQRLQSAIERPPTFAAHADELEAYYGGERPAAGGTNADRSQIVVNWVGEQFLASGIARVNRTVCESLENDARFAVGRDALDRPGVGHLPLPHVADVEVRHSWPPVHTPAVSGRVALIQPWEHGSIPTQWLGPLRDVADELWVPSQHVRGMFTDAGLDPGRVRVIPNGVDLDLFCPAEGDDAADEIVRFLFVGDFTRRKGIDVLLGAWREAFGSDDQVELIIKDFGTSTDGERELLHSHQRDPQVAAITHITEEFSDERLAALLRSCDVLVHPYRGEGFAMPVLEAMASGLPVIVTAGGPTDEFCSEQAGWRIDSRRVAGEETVAGDLELTGPRWELEPDAAHLVALLRIAADNPDARAARGRAGRQEAGAYGWPGVSARYAEAIERLAGRPKRAPAGPLQIEEQPPFVVAAPAWRRADAALSELLRAWADGAAQGTLVLVAQAGRDGSAEEVQAATLAAAQRAGVDLDSCADITIRYEQGSRARDAELVGRATALVLDSHGRPSLMRAAQRAGVPVIAADAQALRQATAEVQGVD